MKFFLTLALIPWVLGAAEPLDELNTYAMEQLAPAGDLQKNLTDEIRTKLITDLGVPKAAAEKVNTSLSDWQYGISFDKACNPWTNGLLARDREYKERLEAQAAVAAAFLSDFHFRMLGANVSLLKVRKIKVCTGGRGPAEPTLSFDRARFELTLWIGPKQPTPIEVPSLRRNNLHPYSLEELKQGWKDGDAFGKKYVVGDFFDARKNPIRVYWKFLNPIGEVRTALRDGIRVAALKSAKAIADLRTDGAAGLREKMLDLLENDAEVKAADDAKILTLAEKWQGKLESPESSEEMAVAALSKSLQSAIESKNTTIKRKQWGFVNVENFHKIDVSLTVGDIPQYREMITVPDNLDIDVSQVGFVNVSTTDRVEVDVVLRSFISPRLFEKATLRTLVHPLK